MKREVDGVKDKIYFGDWSGEATCLCQPDSYPKPASEFLTVKLAAGMTNAMTPELYDTAGKPVLAETIR